MDQGIKLNLGSGARPMAGFINCDLPNNWCKTPPDVECDVTKPLPFPDGYADEIHAYHLFEHFYRWEAPVVLTDWRRVLKPGGMLVLEMPCLDKIIAIFAHALIEGQTPDVRMTMWGLFGDPKYKSPAMCHRWCYSVAELTQGLEILGFEQIEEHKPQTHQPARDMRITARKPYGNDLQHAQD